MIVQCPACRALVSVAAVHVDAARAGVPCTDCGAVTWLPAADSEPAAAPSTAAAPAALPPLAASPAPAALDVRARLAPLLDALPPPTPEQAPLDEAFRALLPTWHDAAAHAAFVKRASVTGDLAFAGQRYRTALEALPGDVSAKKAQGDILGLAMATMHSGADEPPGRPAWLLYAAVTMFVVALGLLGWVVRDVFAADPQEDPATLR